MTVDGMSGGNPTPIFAFTLGASNAASTVSGGGGAGKVTFADLNVSKMVDGLSVPLLKAASTGQHIPFVTIEVFEIGAAMPFAIYRFDDVLVSADVLGGSTTSIGEQVSFNFTKIMSDITFNGTSFHSCYDLKTATSC